MLTEDCESGSSDRWTLFRVTFTQANAQNPLDIVQARKILFSDGIMSFPEVSNSAKTNAKADTSGVRLYVWTKIISAPSTVCVCVLFSNFEVIFERRIKHTTVWEVLPSINLTFLKLSSVQVYFFKSLQPLGLTSPWVISS